MASFVSWFGLQFNWATVLVLLWTAVCGLVTAESGISIQGTTFTLTGNTLSYRFHVDNTTGDLLTDHFGGLLLAADTDNDGILPFPTALDPAVNGWVGLPGRVRREFPDLGRGDFRTPAVRVRQSEGYTVSELVYQSHDVSSGVPPSAGLPGLFAGDGDNEVSTLVVRLVDEVSALAVDLRYSLFANYDAVVRSVNITNMGDGPITVEKLASFSADLPYEDLDMIDLHGDWARENMRTRRKVEYGTQSFGSTTGYSSHLHNPFLGLVTPTTTESQGEAWGFSLVYTGSFQVEVEKGSQGFTRAMLGLNPYHLSWELKPGETLTSPEVVAVYSDNGIGGLSRKFHRLFTNHLIKSAHKRETRPVLLNSWEGLFFDYNQSTIYNLAVEAADLGVKLFVLDDGWFGQQYPRTDDDAGLGDWEVNTAKFPSGSLAPLVDQITNLTAANSATNLRFGLWFEPEMVNPNSTLYNEHPDWVLSAGAYPRTLRRDQLVLNVALPEVQDFIIDAVSNILTSTAVTYVKWDNNRGMHELPSPGTDHAYMLGLYRVFDTLTSRFPDVLWEGCASGGGRFDPGVLQYFPQIWTSDNTDALERIFIQFGTSLVYPPATMGAHLSAVPNGQTRRTTPVAFRAHVAMMGGSFGLELNPMTISAEDRDALPGLIALAERVNPLVISGDLWRLNLPDESNWPAALFIAPDGSSAVLFYFQVRSVWNQATPYLRMQGLDPAARYVVDNVTYSGATLMSVGLQLPLLGDYNSTVVFIDRV